MTRVAGWSLVIALGWGAIRAPADGPPVPTSDVRAARGVEAIAGIGRQVQKLGEWDEMYEMLAPGFDAIWEQNAWNEEADQFALETLHELASIPPWQIQQRMDFLLETVRGRYDLTDAQYNDVRARFQGMIGELAWKHGGTIFRQTRKQCRPVSTVALHPGADRPLDARIGAAVCDDARTGRRAHRGSRQVFHTSAERHA
jgi:hypothetical protein